ncbi:MAG: YCF48-related protein [Acidobacteriota bacterium]
MKTFSEYGGFVPTDLVFTDEKRGYLVGTVQDGKGALILETKDRGRTWGLVFRNSEWLELRRVVFAGETGCAVGGAAIVCTIDGGNHWKEVFTAERVLPFGSVFLVDSNTAWAVGGPGTALKATSVLGTWQRLDLVGDIVSSFLWGIAFLTRNQGWICGDKGAVFETRDGGVSWTQLERPGTGFVRDITVNSTRLLVASDDGIFFRRLSH